jgi:hypothetical protein
MRGLSPEQIDELRRIKPPRTAHFVVFYAALDADAVVTFCEQTVRPIADFEERLVHDGRPCVPLACAGPLDKRAAEKYAGRWERSPRPWTARLASFVHAMAAGSVCTVVYIEGANSV